jgi:dihydroxyacid dehydratase/phosphogluconate dehydratase
MTVQTSFQTADTAPHQGGFAILNGTLAPQGCVVRLDGFSRPAIEGPARVFGSAEEAVAAIVSGRVRSSDMIILRHEGREIDIIADRGAAQVVAALAAAKLEGVTIISDGRIGSDAGISAVGLVAPCASAGGPIAYAQDDDIIHIDIAGRRIDILADIEIRRGRAQRKGKEFGGALEKYAQMVSSAAQPA